MGADGFHGGKGVIWFLNVLQCELMGTWNCPWRLDVGVRETK